LDVPVLSKELIENLTGEEYKVPLFKDTELELPILKWISSEYPAFGGNDTTSKVGEIGEGQLHETQDREYLSERKTDDMVVKGIHLNQFSINLDLDGPQPRWIKNKSQFFRKKTEAKNNTTHERIIGRNTINKASKPRLKFALLPKDFVITNSIKFILLSDKQVDKFYLIGLLNSNVLNWRFELFSSQNNVRNYDIDALPIPRINKTEQGNYSKLVKYIIVLKEQNEEEYAAQAKQILDLLIYELYFNKKFEKEGIKTDLISTVGQSLFDIDLISSKESITRIKKTIDNLYKNKQLLKDVETLKSHPWIHAIEKEFS